MASIKKYWFWGIFVSILTIFAMSHNVSAVKTVFDISNYSNVNSFSSTPLQCNFINGSNLVNTGSGYCRATINSTTNIKDIETMDTYNFEKDDLINFFFIMYSNTGTVEYLPKYVEMTNTSDWDLISYELINADTYFSRLYSYSGSLNQQGANYDLNLDFYNQNSFYRIYDITLRARTKGAKHIGLYSTGGLYSFNSNDVGTQILFTIRNFKHFRFEGSEENREVEEKTQEAVEESEAEGSNSSSTASQGSANLLSAITGFFNVITSASPTNCRFNAPLNTYFGNDRLNVDLCSLDLPSGIGALTSIIAIGILIPFAIHMFNKFIALFRSFQS